VRFVVLEIVMGMRAARACEHEPVLARLVGPAAFVSSGPYLSTSRD